MYDARGELDGLSDVYWCIKDQVLGPGVGGGGAQVVSGRNYLNMSLIFLLRLKRNA